jgi:NAD-dependent dihydropyrimidine dehydrogenase PreA subunit
MIKSIDHTKCTGCGICVEICNMDVIRLNEQVNKAEIKYIEDCMTCYECALRCPENAVSVWYVPEYTPATIEIPGRRK